MSEKFNTGRYFYGGGGGEVVLLVRKYLTITWYYCDEN